MFLRTFRICVIGVCNGSHNLNKRGTNKVLHIRFFNLGSDGLPKRNFYPHMREISLVAMERHMLTPKYTKWTSRNKINLRFTEDWPDDESRSGITPEDIETIKIFLRRLKPPICLVAHNGFKFHFPLLIAELARINIDHYELRDQNKNPIYCGDSIKLCYNFEEIFMDPNEDRPFSMKSIHRRLFKEKYGYLRVPDRSLLIIDIVRLIGDKALTWLDENYLTLNGIKRRFVDTNECKFSSLWN